MMKRALSALALSCLLGAPAFACIANVDCVQDAAPAPKAEDLKNLLSDCGPGSPSCGGGGDLKPQTEEPKALQNLLADCNISPACGGLKPRTDEPKALQNLLADCNIGPTCGGERPQTDASKADENLLACSPGDPACGNVVLPAQAPEDQNLLACNMDNPNCGNIVSNLG